MRLVEQVGAKGPFLGGQRARQKTKNDSTSILKSSIVPRAVYTAGWG